MASVDFVENAFRKLSASSVYPMRLKHEQKEAVDSLLQGRDVLAVMPTSYGKSFIFQLFSTSIELKKIAEGKHANTVVLVICPLTSLIQDQVKEGKSLGLNCACLQDVKDSLSSCPRLDSPQLIFTSAEQVNTVDECLTVFHLFFSSNLSLVIFVRAFKQFFTGFFPM